MAVHCPFPLAACLRFGSFHFRFLHLGQTSGGVGVLGYHSYAHRLQVRRSITFSITFTMQVLPLRKGNARHLTIFCGYGWTGVLP